MKPMRTDCRLSDHAADRIVRDYASGRLDDDSRVYAELVIARGRSCGCHDDASFRSGLGNDDDCRSHAVHTPRAAYGGRSCGERRGHTGGVRPSDCEHVRSDAGGG